MNSSDFTCKFQKKTHVEHPKVWISLILALWQIGLFYATPVDEKLCILCCLFIMNLQRLNKRKSVNLGLAQLLRTSQRCPYSYLSNSMDVLLCLLQFGTYIVVILVIFYNVNLIHISSLHNTFV